MADSIHPTSAEEYRPTLEWYSGDLYKTDPLDWIIAETADGVIGYGHTLRNWSERDGTQVYLHMGWVKPAFRGGGVGTRLLERLENRCREKASKAGHSAILEIAANASSTEAAAQDLLRDHEYFIAFEMLDMILESAPPLGELSLPPEYELRLVLPEHHLMLWQSIGDAYDARDADAPRFSEVPREFKRYFSGHSKLWFVAWEPESQRIAAHVLCRMNSATEGEVFEVSVGVAHRRKGLARALLLRGIRALKESGAADIVIGTRLENPMQAWRLYEARLQNPQDLSALA